MTNPFSWIIEKWRQQQYSSFNPRPSCLTVIEDKPCIPDIYECRHKSKEACSCLLAHNYSAKVVRGPVKRHKKWHIWIELIDEDTCETYWYDPTWYYRDHLKYGCHKVRFWKDRKKVVDEIHGTVKPTGDTSPPVRTP